MKKIIISMFALLILFVTGSLTAHAYEKFNSNPAMPTVTVTNVTDNPCETGPIDGCWKTSVSAQPGDVIGVHIYFYNATDTLAEDTVLSIKPKDSSAKTTHTFTGGVYSPTVDKATGSAVVSISSAQTLEFIPGTVRIIKNGGNPMTVSNENSLFSSSGLFIGDVSPGVQNQGALVAHFRVSENDDEEEDDDCEIESFTADDYSIDEDESTRIRWETSSDCDYVDITHIDDNLDPDGSETVSPNSDTTYRITAFPGGDTDTLTIRVNEDDDNDHDGDDCDIEFYADRTTILRGESTKLHWDVSDGDDIDISHLSSNVSESGSRTVSPNSTTTYKLTVNGGDCDDESKSVTIYVNDVVHNVKPQAITVPATLVAANSARLNGIAVPNANVSTSAWFEWGPTPALGATTPAQVLGSFGSFPYSYAVGGLTPNTTYYFRAVVQNPNGIGFGETLTLRTGAAVSTGSTTRVVQSTRVVSNAVTARSTPSLLELRVESRYDSMCIGGEIEYIVTYKNISKSTLVDAVVQVTHPKQLVFIDATEGDYSASERKLTVALGRLDAGEEGTFRVRARVTRDAVVGDLVVTTATVVYTNPTTRAQEDAIAYSLTNVSDDCPNGFGANALFSGSFLPDTLVEWLLLILVILALIVLGRKLYAKNNS